MTYKSISIDRREEYYQKNAKNIANDPLTFYTKAEKGRKIQGRIQSKDLTLDRLLNLGKKKVLYPKPYHWHRLKEV